MTSNAFAGYAPPIKPPAQCKSLIIDLPPLVPIYGPPALQGVAEWYDADPLAPTDVSGYVNMPAVGAGWHWVGSLAVGTKVLVLELARTTPPNIYTATVTVWQTPTFPESASWPGLDLGEPEFLDTGLLTKVHIPGYDYRNMQVTS